MNNELIKVGVAPIAWSNDDMPELGADITFERCITEMAKAGYAGCEVGHKFPRDPSLLKNALSPLNLDIASAWFSSFLSNQDKQKQNLNDFKVHCDFLQNVGASVVVVAECERGIQQQALPLFENQPQLDKHGWTQLIFGLHEAGKIANDYELTLVYHFHMGTVIQNEPEIKRLLENTDPKWVSLVLDTGHAYMARTNPLDLCQTYISRIKHVHLKDIRPEIMSLVKHQSLTFLQAVREGVFTVPGDGCINFTPILNHLIETQYQGWWVVEAEQDPNKANPLTYARRGRETIKAISGI